MDALGQPDLNPLSAGLDAMGGSVVQRDPIREDVMGILIPE